MWSFPSVLATCSERMKESLCKNSVSTIEVVIKKLRSYIAVYAGFTAKLEMRKISELSGNLKMDSFFSEKSGNYQGILVEYRGNQRQIFFSGKCLVGFIFSYGHFHDLKHFLTLYCYEYQRSSLHLCV